MLNRFLKTKQWWKIKFLYLLIDDPLNKKKSKILKQTYLVKKSSFILNLSL